MQYYYKAKHVASRPTTQRQKKNPTISRGAYQPLELVGDFTVESLNIILNLKGEEEALALDGFLADNLVVNSLLEQC